jgi:NTE family protein
MSEPIPKEQRALVMQGGGALGAYEAGVYRVLHDWVSEKLEEQNRTDENVFDIIAGVSIGSINAAIIVSHVLQNRRQHRSSSVLKCWEGSAEKLEEFWHDLTSPKLSSLASWPIYWIDHSFLFMSWWWMYQGLFRKTYSAAAKYYYKSWLDAAKRFWIVDWPYIPIWTGEELPPVKWISWKDKWREEVPYVLFYFWWPDNHGPVASAEAARRYYSWRYFSHMGAPNVYTPIIPQADLKFFDWWNPNSILYRFGNDPLKRTIKEYWESNDLGERRIKTTGNQPRLLLVSTDLQNSTSVIFDSFEKEEEDDEYGGKICRTVYGEDKDQYTIEYPEGIGMEHLDTSMAFHQRHKYPTLLVRKVKNGHSPYEERPFWDGIYLSNSPLRELIQAHGDYWSPKVKGRKEKEQIPKLKVYIVDLYPITEKGTPEGFDEITDRQYDVLFSDKTRYDEKVAHMVTDYVDLSRKMQELLSTVKDPADRDRLRKELEYFLNNKEIDKETHLEKVPKSRKRNGKPRKYRDLLEGTFEVEVYRIQRSEDNKENDIYGEETDIYGKAFDFSKKTIEDLMDQGARNARSEIASWR